MDKLDLATIVREAQVAMHNPRPTRKQYEAVGRFTAVFTPDMAAKLLAALNDEHSLRLGYTRRHGLPIESSAEKFLAGHDAWKERVRVESDRRAETAFYEGKRLGAEGVRRKRKAT
jgi:hypothetical protein